MANFDRTNLSRKLNESNDNSDIHFVNVEVDPQDSPTKKRHSASYFKINDIIENTKGKAMSIPSSQFVIPTLPKGSGLAINILSNLHPLRTIRLFQAKNPHMSCIIGIAGRCAQVMRWYPALGSVVLPNLRDPFRQLDKAIPFTMLGKSLCKS